MLLSGWSGCRAVSAAVRPLCVVGLSGSCQAVRLGPDSDGTPLMSGSAVRLSETCCQTVGESAVSAVRLSGTVSGAVRGLLSGCQTRAQDAGAWRAAWRVRSCLGEGDPLSVGGGGRLLDIVMILSFAVGHQELLRVRRHHSTLYILYTLPQRAMQSACAR